MYAEEDLVPLSALQQLLFCKRRCALIHIEQAWDDNRFTVEGSLLHQRVHAEGSETRGDMHIARGVSLRSLRLGLSGKADVVEYHRVTDDVPALDERDHRPGAILAGLPGLWQPFPVEYKRGRPKSEHYDLVQLCAQALCLEEVHGVGVPSGALFYGRTRRRLGVDFDAALRHETEDAAEHLHSFLACGQTPQPERGKKCDRCSLVHLCLPKASTQRRSVASYLRDALAEEDLSSVTSAEEGAE